MPLGFTPKKLEAGPAFLAVGLAPEFREHLLLENKTPFTVGGVNFANRIVSLQTVSWAFRQLNQDTGHKVKPQSSVSQNQGRFFKIGSFCKETTETKP